jgi:hypothetical protein
LQFYINEKGNIMAANLEKNHAEAMEVVKAVLGHRGVPEGLEPILQQILAGDLDAVHARLEIAKKPGLQDKIGGEGMVRNVVEDYVGKLNELSAPAEKVPTRH